MLCSCGFGVYCIADEDPRYVCVLQEELLDYYPLQEYKTCGLSVIVLHHCFHLFKVCPVRGDKTRHLLFVTWSLLMKTLQKVIHGLTAIGVETKADLQLCERRRPHGIPQAYPMSQTTKCVEK